MQSCNYKLASSALVEAYFETAAIAQDELSNSYNFCAQNKNENRPPDARNEVSTNSRTPTPTLLRAEYILILA